MTKELISGTVYGIAPWSRELLQISGDVDRGRAEPEDEREQLGIDRGRYWGTLSAAGIDYHGGDFGGTQDYLRSIVKSSEGFEREIDTAPVTRWFDTNTFYRKPTIAGQLSYRPKHEDTLAFQLPIFQPTLLSPYTFARLCAKKPGISTEQAQQHVNELYRQIFSDYARRYVDHVLLHDPFVAYNGCQQEDIDQTVVSVGRLAVEHPAINLGLYFSFGDASDAIRQIIDREVPVAALGCDLQSTPRKSLPTIGSKVFLAGLIDGANTLEEPDALIVKKLDETAQELEPSEISLTHTVDLEHVPRKYALQKIAQIGRIAKKLKGGNENE